MVIVDTHVHVFTEDRKKYPQVHDTERGKAVPTIRDIGQTDWALTDIETLTRLMDEAGVDKATLVQAYYKYEYDNTYTIDAAASDKRFTAVVVLDPLDPKSPDELSRLVEEKHIGGIRFMRGRIPETSLGNPKTFPLWERIQKLKVPLAVNDRVWEISKIRPALERYPDAKVSFEHAWGHKVGLPPYEVLNPLFELAGNPNVYIKSAINNIVAAREAGGNPRDLYAKLVDVFGAKRIMWSSNYPAHPHLNGLKERVEISKQELAFLPREDQEWIFGKTALAFYPALQS